MKIKKSKKIATRDLILIAKMIAESLNQPNMIFTDKNLSFEDILEQLIKEANITN